MINKFQEAIDRWWEIREAERHKVVSKPKPKKKPVKK